MSQAFRQPPIPTAGAKDATGQRLLQGVRELVDTLLRTSVFLERFLPGPVVRGPFTSGAPPQLLWGSMNRLYLTSASPVALPRVESRRIGTLLMVAKGDSVAATVVPSGSPVGDPNSAMSIDGATSRVITAPGLYLFVTDGTMWLSLGAP